MKRFVFKGAIEIFKAHIFHADVFLIKHAPTTASVESEAVIMNGMEIIGVPRGQPLTMLYSEGKMVSRNL